MDTFRSKPYLCWISSSTFYRNSTSVSLHRRPKNARFLRHAIPDRATTLLFQAPHHSRRSSKRKKRQCHPTLHHLKAPCKSQQRLFYFHHVPWASVSSLPPERAALGEAGLAARGLAQHLRAAGADNHRLRVAEDGRDGEAAGALDVHEEAAGAGHERLQASHAC